MHHNGHKILGQNLLEINCFFQSLEDKEEKSHRENQKIFCLRKLAVAQTL